MKLILNNIEKEVREFRFYIVLFFAVIFSLESLVNHYNFRTYSFDLGIYNNSIFQYSHFINNPHPFAHEFVTNFLGDHFALYTIIFSPLAYVFGSYTLLIFQISAVIFGGIGVYKIVKYKYPDSFLAEISIFHFYSFYGIYSALAYDYHDNVVASMFIPWFILAILKNQTYKTIGWAVMICVGKENMPLILAFISCGMIFNTKLKQQRILLALISVISLIYMYIVINMVMPTMLVNREKIGHLRYTILGGSLSEILENLIFKSRYLISALFTNVSIDKTVDWIKEETFFCLFMAGGIGLLIRLEFLLMILPILVQKMYNDDFGKWGINSHYSIEFAPIIVLSLYFSLEKISLKQMYGFAFLFSFLSFSTTFSKLTYRRSYWYSEENTNIFFHHHYYTRVDRYVFNEMCKLIPEEAKLSTASMFSPHLAFRKEIYAFPDTKKADHIFIAESRFDYPLSGDLLHQEILKYINSDEWEIIKQMGDMYLFRRK
ncbi:MAG: DUF2079 domain-containing protein [Bacteroidetes bacterium]|nr:DUF2079 domain-containing protein [Bacteroidota bacterium]MCA6442059.1 DUF2079 domain-containing protein [Bacteroidota bacterium]